MDLLDPNSNSPTMASDASPCDVLKGQLADLKKDIAKNRLREADAKAVELYHTARKNLGAYVIDPAGAAYVTAHELIEALQSTKLAMSRDLQFTLARTARLFCDLTFWQALTRGTPLVYELKNSHIITRLPSDTKPIPEDLAKQLRDSLRKVQTASNDVALRHELECAIEVVKTWPTKHKEIRGEVAAYFFKAFKGIVEGAIAAVASAVSGGAVGGGSSPFMAWSLAKDGYDLIQKLREMKVRGWLLDVFHVYWGGMYALKQPAAYSVVDERIQAEKKEDSVAVGGIAFYADIAWQKEPVHPNQLDAFEALKGLAANTQKWPRRSHRWKVRYYALQQLQALRTYPAANDKNNLVDKVTQFLALYDKKKGEHDQVGSLLSRSVSLSWHVELHTLTHMPPAFSVHEIARINREARKQLFSLPEGQEKPAFDKHLEDEPSDLNLSWFPTLYPSQLSNAPADKLNKVKRLILDSHEHITLDSLRDASSDPRLPSLTELNLARNKKTTDDQLGRFLAVYTGLEVLNIADCEKLTGKHLDQFAGDTLELSRFRLDDPQGLEALLKSGELKHLCLIDVEIANLDLLKKGTSLESLSLSGPAVSSAPLEPDLLSGLTNLKALELTGSTLPDDFELPENVTSLSLTDCKGGVGNVLKSWDSTSLVDLNLKGSMGLGSSHLQQICEKALDLEHLNLCETEVKGEQELVRALLALSSLNTLEISDGIFADLSVLDLSAKAFKDQLGLEDSPVTESGIRCLLPEGVEFPRLRSVNLSECQELSIEGLRCLLSVCPALEDLNLTHCAKIYDSKRLMLENLRSLVPFSPFLGSVEHLEASGQALPVNDIEGAIRQCSIVQTLKLSQLTMSDDLTTAIKSRESLRNLTLTKCTSLTLGQLRTFASHSQLERLELSETPITGEGSNLNLTNFNDLRDELLEMIIDCAPTLDGLTLTGCSKITGEGLKTALRNCTELKTLDLSGWTILETRDSCRGVPLHLSKADFRELVLSLPALQQVLADGYTARLSNALRDQGIGVTYALSALRERYQQTRTELDQLIELDDIQGLEKDGWLLSVVKKADDDRLDTVRETFNSLINYVDSALLPLTSLNPEELPDQPDDVFFYPRQRLTELLTHLGEKNCGLTWCCGPAGVGTTRLVREAIEATDIVDFYPNRYWFRSADQEFLLHSQFALLATELNVPVNLGTSPADLAKAVFRRLEEKGGYFVVIDNVKDFASIQSYLPQGPISRGHIVVTSRDTAVPNSFHIPNLTPDESWEFIDQVFQKIGYRFSYTEDMVRGLAEDLEYNTVGFLQACAFIENSGLKVDQFRGKLTAFMRKFVESDSSLDDHKLPYSLAALWEMSLERLDGSSLAFLDRLAYLGSTSIPRVLIDRHPEQQAVLRRYSLIEDRGPDGYFVSSFLQSVLHIRHSKQPQAKKRILEELMEELDRCYLPLPTSEKPWITNASIVSHAEQVALTYKRFLSTQTAPLSHSQPYRHILDRLGNYYSQLGVHLVKRSAASQSPQQGIKTSSKEARRKGAQYYKEKKRLNSQWYAGSLSKAKANETHGSNLLTLVEQGRTAQDDLNTARNVYSEALQIRLKMGDPYFLKDYVGIGSVLIALRDHAEALKMLTEGSERLERWELVQEAEYEEDFKQDDFCTLKADLFTLLGQAHMLNDSQPGLAEGCFVTALEIYKRLKNKAGEEKVKTYQEELNANSK